MNNKIVSMCMVAALTTVIMTTAGASPAYAYNVDAAQWGEESERNNHHRSWDRESHKHHKHRGWTSNLCTPESPIEEPTPEPTDPTPPPVEEPSDPPLEEPSEPPVVEPTPPVEEPSIPEDPTDSENLADWTQIYTETFDTDAALGQFESVYGSEWTTACCSTNAKWL